MKKLMTILGAFMIASVVLTSCGGPDACECMDNAFKIMTDKHDADLHKKCEDHVNGLEGDAKKEWNKELLDCFTK